MIEHVEELRLAQPPSPTRHAGSLDHNGNPADTMGQPGGVTPLLEAVLGHGLRHANVVETYKYATRRAEVRKEEKREEQERKEKKQKREEKKRKAKRGKNRIKKERKERNGKEHCYASHLKPLQAAQGCCPQTTATVVGPCCRLR